MRDCKRLGALHFALRTSTGSVWQRFVVARLYELRTSHFALRTSHFALRQAQCDNDGLLREYRRFVFATASQHHFQLLQTYWITIGFLPQHYFHIVLSSILLLLTFLPMVVSSVYKGRSFALRPFGFTQGRRSSVWQLVVDKWLYNVGLR